MSGLGKVFCVVLCLPVLYGFDCTQASFLRSGDTATCTGILVPELQLSLMREDIENGQADLDYCAAHRRLDNKEFSLRLDKASQLLGACENEVQALRATALEAANLDEPEVPWYETVPFVVSITAIVSIGLSVGFYALADHLAEQE